MSLPTVDQFLSKLDANPAEAAAFDAATKRERPHCKTRREACEHLLASLHAKTASITASNESKRQALLATKELERAAEAMKAERARARRSVSPIPAKPAAVRPAPRPVASKPAPTPSKTPHLDTFNRLTGEQATAYYKANSKAIIVEQRMANFKPSH